MRICVLGCGICIGIFQVEQVKVKMGSFGALFSQKIEPLTQNWLLEEQNVRKNGRRGTYVECV